MAEISSGGSVDLFWKDQFLVLHGLFGKCYSFAQEHVYGLPNHARNAVADLWYTACFVLKFN
jgi:hypothetical protein